MLGVPEELLKKHGAVSQPVALAMADCALDKSHSSWTVSVTGLAGPGGDKSGCKPGEVPSEIPSEIPSEEVPTGTVWIGVAGGNDGSRAKRYLFEGSRNEVREAAAAAALEELLNRIHQSGFSR